MLFLLTGGYYVQVPKLMTWMDYSSLWITTASCSKTLTAYSKQNLICLWTRNAAHTKIHAVVEVLVLHALRLQAAFEGSILGGPTFRLWKQRWLQDTAELIILWHSQLEWRLARTLVSACHGIWLPPLRILLPSQENQHLPFLIKKMLTERGKKKSLYRDQRISSSYFQFWCHWWIRTQ